MVSFPPLIDMLKFSGYSYLIRGQRSVPLGCSFPAGRPPRPETRRDCARFQGDHRRSLWEAAQAQSSNARQGLSGANDTRIGMPARMLAGAMCVQRFDDSRNSAIRITYRISLRSSSMPEPRDPLLKVLIASSSSRCQRAMQGSCAAGGASRSPFRRARTPPRQRVFQKVRRV